jgi:hypothetical protein
MASGKINLIVEGNGVEGGLYMGEKHICIWQYSWPACQETLFICKKNFKLILLRNGNFYSLDKNQ